MADANSSGPTNGTRFEPNLGFSRSARNEPLEYPTSFCVFTISFMSENAGLSFAAVRMDAKLAVYVDDSISTAKTQTITTIFEKMLLSSCPADETTDKKAR